MRFPKIISFLARSWVLPVQRLISRTMTSSVTINSPIKSVASTASKWQLEEEAPVDGAAAIGYEFARAITAIANGTYDQVVAAEKKYPPFKKVFWDDTKYNPPLANTHMNYEYDSQIGDIEREWKKRGHKFTNDRRMAKIIFEAGLRGPTKQPEYPLFFEKPQKINERKREIRPFSRAHPYNKPVERTSNVPSENDASLYPPPGAYTLPDPWKNSLKSVCGVFPESPPFRSKTPLSFGSAFAPPKDTSLPKPGVNTKQRTSKPNTNTFRSPPGSPPTVDTRIPYSPLRSLDMDPVSRPQSPSMTTFAQLRQEPPNLSPVDMQHLMNSLSVQNEGAGRSSGQEGAHQQRPIPRSFSTLEYTLDAPQNKETKPKLTRDSSRVEAERSRAPGVSIARSSPPSIWDNIANTLSDGRVYKRARMPDGSFFIFATDPGKESPSDLHLPAGAVIEDPWAQTQHIAEKDPSLQMLSTSFSRSRDLHYAGAAMGHGVRVEAVRNGRSAKTLNRRIAAGGFSDDEPGLAVDGHATLQDLKHHHHPHHHPQHQHQHESSAGMVRSLPLGSQMEEDSVASQGPPLQRLQSSSRSTTSAWISNGSGSQSKYANAIVEKWKPPVRYSRGGIGVVDKNPSVVPGTALPLRTLSSPKHMSPPRGAVLDSYFLAKQEEKHRSSSKPSSPWGDDPLDAGSGSMFSSIEEAGASQAGFRGVGVGRGPSSRRDSQLHVGETSESKLLRQLTHGSGNKNNKVLRDKLVKYEQKRASGVYDVPKSRPSPNRRARTAGASSEMSEVVAPPSRIGDALGAGMLRKNVNEKKVASATRRSEELLGSADRRYS